MCHVCLSFWGCFSILFRGRFTFFFNVHDLLVLPKFVLAPWRAACACRLFRHGPAHVHSYVKLDFSAKMATGGYFPSSSRSQEHENLVVKAMGGRGWAAFSCPPVPRLPHAGLFRPPPAHSRNKQKLPYTLIYPARCATAYPVPDARPGRHRLAQRLRIFGWFSIFLNVARYNRTRAWHL